MAMGVFHPYLLRVPEDAYQILSAEASARGISVNSLFIRAFAEHLRTKRKEITDLIGEEAAHDYRAVLDKLDAVSSVPARRMTSGSDDDR